MELWNSVIVVVTYSAGYETIEVFSTSLGADRWFVMIGGLK